MLREMLMCMIVWLMAHQTAIIVNKICSRREEEDHSS